MEEEVWYYIALAIVVAGVAAVIIGAAISIKAIKGPMKEMKKAADDMKERMQRFQLETTRLQHNVQELTDDMQYKTKAINTLTSAAKGTVNSIMDLNAAIRAITQNITERTDRNPVQQEGTDRLVNTAMDIIDIVEERKAQIPHTYTTHSERVIVRPTTSR